MQTSLPVNEWKFFKALLAIRVNGAHIELGVPDMYASLIDAAVQGLFFTSHAAAGYISCKS